MDYLGYLGGFLVLEDERPAAEQINERYGHGGGWFPMKNWVMDPITFKIQYPGDPPLRYVASTNLREERIFLYPHGIVTIVQPDGTFQTARID